MLSPKEKAKELIEKFRKHTYECVNTEARQCALICVNEILDLMINTFKWDEKHNGNSAKQLL